MFFRKDRLKKVGLNSYVKGLLTLSGFFQLTILTTHIATITGIYETIIGLYMFVFVLASIFNILNGFNFSSKKSVITLIATYFGTSLQTLFGGLFLSVLFHESATIPEVVMDSNMILSISFILFSIVASIIATILATIFYLKKSEVNLYL